MMKVQENIFFNEFSSGDLYLPASVKNCDIAVLLIHGGSVGSVAPRHQQKVNILFADMHAAPVQANSVSDPHSADPFLFTSSNSIKYFTPSGDWVGVK